MKAPPPKPNAPINTKHQLFRGPERRSRRENIGSRRSDSLHQPRSFKTAESADAEPDIPVSTIITDQIIHKLELIYKKISIDFFRLPNLLYIKIFFVDLRPAELPFEFGPSEDERRRPAVRAMMRIRRQMTTLQQRLDLKRRKRIPRLHRGLTRDHT